MHWHRVLLNDSIRSPIIFAVCWGVFFWLYDSTAIFRSSILISSPTLVTIVMHDSAIAPFINSALLPAGNRVLSIVAAIAFAISRMASAHSPVLKQLLAI